MQAPCFFRLLVFIPMSQGAFEPWASNTDPTDVPKSHVQDVTTAPFTYNITQGGTIDGKMCTTLPGVWEPYEQTWESNRSLRMENVGATNGDQPVAENRPHRLLLPADDRRLGYGGAFDRPGKGPRDLLLLHHPSLPQGQWRQRSAGRRFAGHQRLRFQHLRKQHALHVGPARQGRSAAISSSAIAPAIACRRSFSTASTTRSTGTWPPSCSCGTTTPSPTSGT